MNMYYSNIQARKKIEYNIPSTSHLADSSSGYNTVPVIVASTPGNFSGLFYLQPHSLEVVEVNCPRGIKINIVTFHYFSVVT